MSNKAKEILAKLVSFPVLGGESNRSIIEYIAAYLDEYNVDYKLLENKEEDKASLHCRIGPAVDGGVILSGHTDVVPVEGQDWHTEPFTLTEKDGLLYGRGSCDMKGFIACVLACVPDMLAANLERPIYFAFSYDEEVGCIAGPELAAAFHSDYEETPKYVLVGEPSLLQPVVGHKGICVFKTTVNGSAGHSSKIRTEVSAIHESMRLILWLEEKMNALIEAGHIDDRFVPNHTSIHSGIIKGGIAHNVICDDCSFVWDVRVIPQDSVAEIKADFDAYCREREAILQERFSGFKINTELYHPDVPPLDTPEHLEIVDWIKNLSGRDDLITVAYAAEAGQFSEAGFQTVICGPGSIDQAHRADEFIAVEQLGKGVDFIKKLIVDLSK
jgi:acetylornithine deacetylase